MQNNFFIDSVLSWNFVNTYIFKLIEMCEDNKTKATPVVRTKGPFSDSCLSMQQLKSYFFICKKGLTRMHGSNFEIKCDQKTVSCQYKFRTFGGKMFK